MSFTNGLQCNTGMVVHHNNDRSKIGQSLLINVYLSKKDSKSNNLATDDVIQATQLYLKSGFSDTTIFYTKNVCRNKRKTRDNALPLMTHFREIRN